MEISIYTSGFNLLKNNFDYEDALENFCKFAEEVVICLNPSVDNTLEAITVMTKIYPNLKIVESDYSYENPLFVGLMKNDALQATTKTIKVGLDMDERVPLRHKSRWIGAYANLEFMPCNCVMIPVVNMWGSKDTIKNDPEDLMRGRKWYLHGEGCFRGPVNFGRNPDGTIDTSRSDTCELIDADGNLIPSIPIVPKAGSIEEYLKILEDRATFVYHLGYESYKNRIDRNNDIWHNHIRLRSGGQAPQHTIHMDESEFNEEIINHNLPHWNE